MKELLKIEWLKLKKYTAFKLLTIFFAIGVVAANLIVFAIERNVVSNVNTGGLIARFLPYSFNNTWQTTSYVTGFLIILPAMLLIILVTNEFAFRTNRQNIIDGWSRSEFINVKLALAFLIALGSTLLVFLTALSFGLFSGTEFSLNRISHVGFFFLKALSYNLVAVLFAVLVRRTGFAIGLFFIYMFAENILSSALDIFSIYVKKHSATDLGGAGDYLPMNASDGLLTFPESTFSSIAKAALPVDYTYLVLGLAFAYLALFIWWSRKRLINSDL